MNATNRLIENYTKRIADETEKLEQHTQAKRDEVDRKLKDAQQELRDAEKELADVRTEKQAKHAEMQRLAADGEQAEKAREDAKKAIMDAQAATANARQQEDNALAVYGNNMKQVLEMVQRTQWKGQPPVGPLGTYVKVKDPKRWGEVLRMQLGGHMSAFAVTDARDRPVLKRILNQTGNAGTTILISEVDMFDFSHGEPPSNVLTVLRALDISDPYVLRLLVNAHNIERTVLAEDRAEGDRILKSLRSGVAWTRDTYRVQRYG
ncbi:hypothetical protein GLOTRDRAFT_49654 [Gloeophyllum trabeum ATCC 11539]|uniref:SMC hinge domain-containing protein n=1 Tax=Gloeophyllum trabeum (strain ATCC 11539 / FP-39264 / Madison 617) TaxID=670483 RepID=S7PTJ1_GLOTA|nr:uncharacterized protein GLOTRDRAFT_49654 [Gloeophyllum trabeum ATCC 11539]EPQ51081.1 hypothetical protein GLOTRDRAFT_49654 [Gloeophyllum trabeum ATCC 11539]